MPRADGGLSPRERRTVAWGAGVALTALLVVKGALPFVQAWRAREVQIERAAARVAQLRQLAAQTPALVQAAAMAERELAGAPRRALHARSAALAASALQALLQDASDGAGVAVSRVDASATPSGTAVQATLSVVGDIHGLAALLHTMEQGPRVMTVERLTVVQNTALRGAPDVLQIAVTVRAPVVLE